MSKGLATFSPHFRIKRGLFTARKEIPILLLNSNVGQLSKNIYTLGKESVEENYIPLETQSQANTAVTPSEPEGIKGKGKTPNEGLITAKKWTPIATQRSRKPQNSASIQGKPTLTACTGKITIINPVVTSKGKLPKLADNKVVKGTVKGTSNQRTGKIWIKFISSTNSSNIYFNGAPGISLGRTWSKFPEDLSQRDRLQTPYDNNQRLESRQAVHTPGGEGKQDKGESSHYPSYRRTTDPDRAHSDSHRLTRSTPNQLSSYFTPFRNQQISGQESPLFILPGGSRRRQGHKGRNKTSFHQRQRESEPIIQKLFELVKEVHKNQK
ncbi:hypothetical protein O181_073540 [Austropuccinia psidii MF-1]|uniref:Uncharacterized protein n=1 Tax=Austropuccinia psidii MF-1 TaxID=1389203 RepID=A0A9Q3FAR0_9BASI|nr:hypothetical protein [Austropuccinia psidii MF-1]